MARSPRKRPAMTVTDSFAQPTKMSGERPAKYGNPAPPPPGSPYPQQSTAGAPAPPPRSPRNPAQMSGPAPAMTQGPQPSMPQPGAPSMQEGPSIQPQGRTYAGGPHDTYGPPAGSYGAQQEEKYGPQWEERRAARSQFALERGLQADWRTWPPAVLREAQHMGLFDSGEDWSMPTGAAEAGLRRATRSPRRRRTGPRQSMGGQFSGQMTPV